MTTSSVRLDQLPPDVFGNILHFLNLATGTCGILNKADIPVVMKNASQLMLVNKQMYANCNNPIATDIFLKSLAQSYGKSPANFAAELNTKSARLWLWEYIKKSNYISTYQTIQGIEKIYKYTIREAHIAGLPEVLDEHLKDQNGKLEFDGTQLQTESDFILYTQSYPKYIATPLGEVKFNFTYIQSYTTSLSITELFLQRVHARFITCGSFVGKVSEIASSGKNKFRTITQTEIERIQQEDIDKKRGSQNLIINDTRGQYSTYQIHLNDQPQEQPLAESKSAKSDELIKILREMIQAHSLEKDPIAKPIVPVYQVQKFESDNSLSFNNIFEITPWAIKKVEELDKQPLLSISGFFKYPTKILILTDTVETKLIDSLTTASQKFIDENAQWTIHSFGSGYNVRYYKGKQLGYGIELWRDEDEQHKQCSLETLSDAYNLTLKEIGSGWKEAKLQDHPSIILRQSEEEWTLFVKNKFSDVEKILISLITITLGISRVARCFIIKNSTTNNNQYSLFMWVRKDKLKEVFTGLQMHVD